MGVNYSTIIDFRVFYRRLGSPPPSLFPLSSPLSPFSAPLSPPLRFAITYVLRVSPERYDAPAVTGRKRGKRERDGNKTKGGGSERAREKEGRKKDRERIKKKGMKRDTVCTIRAVPREIFFIFVAQCLKFSPRPRSHVGRYARNARFENPPPPARPFSDYIDVVIHDAARQLLPLVTSPGVPWFI